jgi:hypothetical protein
MVEFVFEGLMLDPVLFLPERVQWNEYFDRALTPSIDPWVE